MFINGLYLSDDVNNISKENFDQFWDKISAISGARFGGTEEAMDSD